MYFHALIPFKPVNPKTRLACILSQEEREAFARTMLEDVIGSVLKSGCSATLLCTHPFKHADALIAVRKEPLNEAINWALAQFHCSALIIMADLPLVTAGDIQRLIRTEKDMAIVPGRGGGDERYLPEEARMFLRRLLWRKLPRSYSDCRGVRLIGRRDRLVPDVDRYRREGGPCRDPDPRERAKEQGVPGEVRIRPRHR